MGSLLQLDYTRADEQMKLFKDQGFRMPVVSYCAFEGLDTYHRDESAMQGAGFTDYPTFLKTVFSAVRKHADAAGWLPVYSAREWDVGIHLSRCSSLWRCLANTGAL